MIMSLLLFETEFQNIVAISFTALILNELIMVALEITTWSVRSHYLDYRLARLLPGESLCDSRHLYMIISEVVTFIFYGLSMALLPEYFGQSGGHLSSACASSLTALLSFSPDLSFVISTRFAWKVALIVEIGRAHV